MADQPKQALSGAEEQNLAQQQAVEQAEAQTGTEPVARSAVTEDPTTLDRRFDRDDLRQGKPAPAVKKHKLRMRRHRKAKGKPLTAEERQQARAGKLGEEGPDMTDEEVEMTDDESSKQQDSGEDNKGIIEKVKEKIKS